MSDLLASVPVLERLDASDPVGEVPPMHGCDSCQSRFTQPNRSIRFTGSQPGFAGRATGCEPAKSLSHWRAEAADQAPRAGVLLDPCTERLSHQAVPGQFPPLKQNLMRPIRRENPWFFCRRLPPNWEMDKMRATRM